MRYSGLLLLLVLGCPKAEEPAADAGSVPDAAPLDAGVESDTGPGLDASVDAGAQDAAVADAGVADGVACRERADEAAAHGAADHDGRVPK